MLRACQRDCQVSNNEVAKGRVDKNSIDETDQGHVDETTRECDNVFT